MQNKNEKLESLKSQFKELSKKHFDKHFKNEKEGKEYIKKNETELKKLNRLQKEIKEIEWELMTEDEKKAYLDEVEKIREKHSNG
ncbi:MAG: hypothetical protein WCP57_08720 [Bacteroidota bacterium]